MPALLGILTVSISKTNTEAKGTLGGSPADGSKSVAYQIDPAHTGSSSEAIVPPLVRHWSRDLGGPISSPVIADGNVFVTVGNQTPTGVSGSSICVSTP